MDDEERDQHRQNYIRRLQKVSQSSVGRNKISYYGAHIKNPNIGRRTGRYVPFDEDASIMFQMENESDDSQDSWVQNSSTFKSKGLSSSNEDMSNDSKFIHKTKSAKKQSYNRSRHSHGSPFLQKLTPKSSRQANSTRTPSKINQYDHTDEMSRSISPVRISTPKSAEKTNLGQEVDKLIRQSLGGRAVSYQESPIGSPKQYSVQKNKSPQKKSYVNSTREILSPSDSPRKNVAFKSFGTNSSRKLSLNRNILKSQTRNNTASQVEEHSDINTSFGDDGKFNGNYKTVAPGSPYQKPQQIIKKRLTFSNQKINKPPVPKRRTKINIVAKSDSDSGNDDYNPVPVYSTSINRDRSINKTQNRSQNNRKNSLKVTLSKSQKKTNSTSKIDVETDQTSDSEFYDPSYNMENETTSKQSSSRKRKSPLVSKATPNKQSRKSNQRKSDYYDKHSEETTSPRAWLDNKRSQTLIMDPPKSTKSIRSKKQRSESYVTQNENIDIPSTQLRHRHPSSQSENEVMSYPFPEADQSSIINIVREERRSRGGLASSTPHRVKHKIVRVRSSSDESTLHDIENTYSEKPQQIQNLSKNVKTMPTRKSAATSVTENNTLTDQSRSSHQATNRSVRQQLRSHFVSSDEESQERAEPTQSHFPYQLQTRTKKRKTQSKNKTPTNKHSNLDSDYSSVSSIQDKSKAKSRKSRSALQERTRIRESRKFQNDNSNRTTDDEPQYNSRLSKVSQLHKSRKQIQSDDNENSPSTLDTVESDTAQNEVLLDNEVLPISNSTSMQSSQGTEINEEEYMIEDEHDKTLTESNNQLPSPKTKKTTVQKKNKTVKKPKQKTSQKGKILPHRKVKSQEPTLNHNTTGKRSGYLEEYIDGLPPLELVKREPSPEAIARGLRRSTRVRPSRLVQHWLGENMIYSENKDAIGLQGSNFIDSNRELKTTIPKLPPKKKNVPKKQKVKAKKKKINNESQDNSQEAPTLDNGNLSVQNDDLSDVNETMRSKKKERKKKNNLPPKETADSRDSDRNKSISLSFNENIEDVTCNNLHTQIIQININETLHEVGANKVFSFFDKGKFTKNDSSGVYFLKNINTSRFSAGTLYIDPGRDKILSSMQTAALCYSVLEGSVSVTLSDRKTRMGKGDMFHVPCKNEYAIQNLDRKNPALLQFTQIKNKKVKSTAD